MDENISRVLPQQAEATVSDLALQGKIHMNKSCPYCKGEFVIITPESTGQMKVMHTKGACPKFDTLEPQAYVDSVSPSRAARRAAKSKKQGAAAKRRPRRRK